MMGAARRLWKAGRRLLAQLGMLFLGNLVGAALGFAVLVLLTRTLSPADFGKLAPALTLLDIAQVLIDCAVFAGALQVAARYLQRDPEKAQMALKIALLMRLALSVVIAAGVWIAAPWLAKILFGDESGTWMLRSAASAVVGVALYTHGLSVALTRQAFYRAAVLTVAKNGTRALLLLALVAAGALTLETAIWAVVVSVGIAALLCVVLLPFDYVRVPGIDRALLWEILSINRWAAVAAVGMLGARIDIYMLSALSSSEDTAYYAASMQLCTVVVLFSQALANFIFPKLAAQTTRASMRRHFRRGMMLMPALLPPLLLLVLLADWIVPLIFGSDYASAVPVFSLLAISAFLTLAFNPVGLLLFPLGEVRVLALAAVAQLALRVMANLMVIPEYGAVGASAVDLGVKAATNAVVMALLFHLLWQRPRRRIVAQGN